MSGSLPQPKLSTWDTGSFLHPCKNTPHRYCSSSSVSPHHRIQHSFFPCSDTDSQDDSPHEHSEILPLGTAGDVILFPRRLPFSHSDNPILVSRLDVLLFHVIMCFIWCYCEHSTENCGTTDPCSVGYCTVFCAVEFVDRMGMGG